MKHSVKKTDHPLYVFIGNLARRKQLPEIHFFFLIDALCTLPLH